MTALVDSMDAPRRVAAAPTRSPHSPAGVAAVEPRELLDEPLLTAAQVGSLLGDIPPKTILQYARDGRLPCVRIGKHVRFVRSDIRRALIPQRSAAGTARSL
jgi:excisionase family DNA binding protein